MNTILDMKKFVMLDGYVSMDNTQLYLDVNQTKKDLKSRGGWLGVFFVFVGISVIHTFKRMELLNNLFEYFDFVLRVFGAITIIAVIIYLLFLKKSEKNCSLTKLKN